MKSSNNISGLLNYAKTPGITSFSSLWSIKHALGTEKVGHTGTLDSFAEGLLVVLTGHMTHLVPHITGFTKTYEAIVCFGKETDTLDPTGEITATGFSPAKEQVEAALPSFRGAILQTPPLYSALHVDGKRASDMVREGKEVVLESRQIFIYAIDLLDFKPQTTDDACSYAHLKIVCSKGTYIRSIARDLAKKIGTCAHLSALRRTQVGPFRLEDAACFSELKEFSIENGIENEKRFADEKKAFVPAGILPKKKENKKEPPEKIRDIQEKFTFFSPEIASECGFESLELKPEAEKSYLNGRPLSKRMFSALSNPGSGNRHAPFKEIAVFYKNRTFAGMIRENEFQKLSYGFVARPEEQDFRVFTWKDIVDGKFPFRWQKQGCAITVGNYEAMHLGHKKILDKIKEDKKLVPGVVTFSASIKPGDRSEVFTLRQRLGYLKDSGFGFAVVIDFTPEFSHIGGEDFLETLSRNCGMKMLAEGNDFKCGWKGECSMEKIRGLSKDRFELVQIEHVVFRDQKISSSLIKRLVLDGNFSEIQEMLKRPFKYDGEGLKWKKVADGKESCVFEAAPVSEQVLPGNGEYPVIAEFDDNTILHTSIRIDSRHIYMDLPSQNFADRLRYMSFQ